MKKSSVIKKKGLFDHLNQITAVQNPNYWDELSEEDKLIVARARKIQRFLSQPFHVAEVFTGFPGKFVEIADTIKGFKDLCSGKYDDIPEAAFYMVGTIDEALDVANVKKRYFVEGNHDDWLNKFVYENPYLERYKVKECLKLLIKMH